MTSSKYSFHKLHIVIISLLLCAALGAGFLIGFANSKNSTYRGNNPLPSPTSLPEKDIVCTMDAKICPDGTAVGRTGPNCEFAECPDKKTENSDLVTWRTEKIEECSLSVNVPTFTKPVEEFNNLDKDKEWNIRSQRLDINYEPFTFMTNINYYQKNGLGSGYTSGSVTIECAPNTKKFTTSSLFVELKQTWESKSNEYMTFQLVKLEDTRINNIPAIKYKLTGGQELEQLNQYILATDTHIYTINHISMSENELLQKTTKQIFDSITIE